MQLISALGLEPEELVRQCVALGLPRFRGEQIFRALHQSHAGEWDEIRQIPAAEREQLAGALGIEWPSIDRKFGSADGTIRYLLRLADGARVEAVYLPEEDLDLGMADLGMADGAAPPRRTRIGDGAPQPRRATFCISTQVGCAVNCQFCFTAMLGLTRNLTAAEIVAQVLTLLREHGLRAGTGLDRVNVVYMGMGEPFLNYEQVVRSIRLLTHPRGASLAPRRITVSTSGIVDKIRRWGREAFPAGRPRLAISLNASSDEQRQRLMPINQAQGGLAALLEAAGQLPLGPREYVFFEYVLLAGVNDELADADRVVELLRGQRAKINLIAWNMGSQLPFQSPERSRVLAFQARLIERGLATYIRRPRGRDIDAACGQLQRAAGMAPALGG